MKNKKTSYQVVSVLFVFSFLVISGWFLLDITPQEIDIVVYTENSENFYINLTNNMDQDVFFVTLSSDNGDISFIDNKFNLSEDQQKQVKGVIDTSTSYSGPQQIKIIYFKKSDVVLEPQDKVIEISVDGFDPQNTNIIKGAKVTWKNIDSIKHTVTSSLFDEDIEPGQEFSYTFNEAGEFSYSDKHSVYTDTIYVQDKIGEDYVHNPEEAQYVTLNVESILIETDLEIALLDGKNFTVEVGDSVETVLSIKNVGGQTASSIDFSSSPNWISFGKEDIYIEQGKTSFVPFTIAPIVSNKNQTNKNYQIELSIFGNNTARYNLILDIFVPYKETIDFSQVINQSLAGFTQQEIEKVHILFCEAYSQHEFCKPKEVERIVYRAKTIEYNVSVEDIIENRRRLEENLDFNERLGKQLTEKIDTIEGKTSTTDVSTRDTQIIVEDLYNKQIENEQNIDQLYTGIIIIAIFGLLGGGGYLGYVYMRENIKKRKYDTM